MRDLGVGRARLTLTGAGRSESLRDDGLDGAGAGARWATFAGLLKINQCYLIFFVEVLQKTRLIALPA